MRIKIIMISLLLLVGFTSIAQKYKDVFLQIVMAEEDNAFGLLNAYLQDNLDHPNANLRVALIYAARYRSVDALREYERVIALANRAKEKLLKASLVVTEKEFKKNSDYYLGMVKAGNIPSYFEITELIKQERLAVEEFLQNVPPIYNEFTQSVEKYDAAVKNFAGILGSYASFKELYLLYDDELKSRLDRLKISYDSTKLYFDRYLTLRNRFEITAVEQSYSENAIKVYRLDGLVTQINFLQPKISLWNYAAWVDSINVVMSEKIDVLREDLIANEKKLRAAVTEVSGVQNLESFKVVHADKSLIFNLLRYDYKNAIVPLLAYYEFQQQFIIDQKRNIYFDTAAIAKERKLAYYSNMMYAAKRGDSIITEFETRFNPVQLKRHQKFVDKTFGGTEQMKVYMADEKTMNNKIFIHQIANIKDEILLETIIDSLGGSVKYRRIKIPIHIINESLADLPQGEIKTQYILTAADESIYIAGQQISDSKKLNHELIIAKLSVDLKPIWFKNIDLEIDSAGVDANHWLGDVKLTSEGIALVVRSVALDSSKVINTLLHITETGGVKFARRLETELYPRELNFIETSNMFVLAFFGESNIMDAKLKSELKVLGINGLGEKLWQYDYSLSGDFQQIIHTQNSIIIGGNYSVIKNKAGLTYTSPSGTNAYMMSLSLNGELEQIQCLASDTPYKVISFYKVNDNNINLLGAKNEHIIINSKLEEIYSSINLK